MVGTSISLPQFLLPLSTYYLQGKCSSMNFRTMHFKLFQSLATYKKDLGLVRPSKQDGMTLWNLVTILSLHICCLPPRLALNFYAPTREGVRDASPALHNGPDHFETIAFGVATWIYDTPPFDLDVYSPILSQKIWTFTSKH